MEHDYQEVRRRLDAEPGGRFPAGEEEGEEIETEVYGPHPRDDREARELLRLGELEGLDPVQCAFAGQACLDRLDRDAEAHAGTPQGEYSDALRRELREIINQVSPLKTTPQRGEKHARG